MNREANFKVFVLFRFNDIDLRKMFWTSIITKPRPNSTADRISRKNVSDSKFTLLKIKPINKVITYKVIHMNSAVNSRCREVFTFSTILRNIIKNSIKRRFKSPKDITYLDIG